MDHQRRKHKYTRPRSNPMSLTTKKFLQKICYKETASVDMTQYGFMRDSKAFLVKLLNKSQLENNCGNSLQPKKQERNTKIQRGIKKKNAQQK